MIIFRALSVSDQKFSLNWLKQKKKGFIDSYTCKKYVFRHSWIQLFNNIINHAPISKLCCPLRWSCCLASSFCVKTRELPTHAPSSWLKLITLSPRELLFFYGSKHRAGIVSHWTNLGYINTSLTSTKSINFVYIVCNKWKVYGQS